MSQSNYTEDNIRSLDWKSHIRMRPGMYIGKLGDGSAADDGIYILIKEVIDNSVDEFVMGFGKSIDITIKEGTVSIRDYGRGIPLGKIVEVVSKMNTGGKYDNRAFKKSVGLNGVGTKAVNALSNHFEVSAFRDGQMARATFKQGELLEHAPPCASQEPQGTAVVFTPDASIFKNYKYRDLYVVNMFKNYSYLNPGLSLVYNGVKYKSKDGLKDLLLQNISVEHAAYPAIHLKETDIEIAMTHIQNQYSETYYTFVNGQHTTQGGTHQNAIKEALVKVIRDFFGKQFDAADIRKSVVLALSLKVMNPIFESQTKTKLGSTDMGGGLPTIRTFINDFIKRCLDNYLHKNPETVAAIKGQILRAERERKELSGVRKLARERAKKSNLHNKNLRDCRIHFNDLKKENRLDTTLFITEGDSASGSITKSRNVLTQAVFSLRGKPKNVYGDTKKIVYENVEFNLLQAALNIEEGIENLRYNKVVIATDADPDGMHIRYILLTFFLYLFPEVIKAGHLYFLETPLFRVRNKKITNYCYDEKEKQVAMAALNGTLEITRFKGLGEISPEEFGHFIGEEMRLLPVVLEAHTAVADLLRFYMGDNTPQRQQFIMKNLRNDEDFI